MNTPITSLNESNGSPEQPSSLFVGSGSYPLREGNLVKTLHFSGPTFRRICEAIENAEHSVWVTIAFADPQFVMPDGRGTLFDVLDRAAERGLDVRVIFWRPDAVSANWGPTFSGTPDDRELLMKRGAGFRIRWDRAHPEFCHHQKSWLIDAGHSTEVGFIGGINLTFGLFERGQAGDGHRHDTYLELQGPSATDIHHNFVQRWNETSERGEPDGRWANEIGDTLLFPSKVSEPRGTTLLQIQRTIHAGRYTNGHPTPGGGRFDISAGERTILEQYIHAINFAKKVIYIENQAFPIPQIVEHLDKALKRGVLILMLSNIEIEKSIKAPPATPYGKNLTASIATLRQHENFSLVGAASPNGRDSVYVHGKLMLVDDVWATIGSCNLHERSLLGHSEMNASIYDPNYVSTLRRELLEAHLGCATNDLTAVDAAMLYRQIARANRTKRDAGDLDWQGLVFELDISASA